VVATSRAICPDAAAQDGNTELAKASAPASVAGPEAADRQVASGNDLLDSGVSAADTMDGGFGDHVYIVNDAGDVAAEVASGIDTV
jgi:hypothetical protein